ncbi:hypothetical protein J4729_07485 [Leisingera sp. HS039]|uniref:hypothetical protein n=1 Tax=Leisingera sp. HS039 TaxID=2818496 RepID=UPI001B3A5D4A|nr:hypothetical protein [Leisingera sp. HS039]MBQ4824391.1 hypothetical protein [Leisingera sp. HS039]
MKKYILAAAVLINSAVNTSAADYSQAQVKAECSTKWGSQYDMVKYCIDRRKEGWTGYTSVKETLGGNQNFAPSLLHCEGKWEQQWDMVLFCARKQMEGMGTLVDILETLPAEIGREVAGTCIPKWEPQFDMIAFCAEKQSSAWRAINQ